MKINDNQILSFISSKGDEDMYFGIKDIINETVSGVPNEKILEAVNEIIRNTETTEIGNTK